MCADQKKIAKIAGIAKIAEIEKQTRMIRENRFEPLHVSVFSCKRP